MESNHSRSQRGVTLVESMITLAVVTVGLGAALPSFERARERRHLDGAVAQVATDLRHARSAAVAMGTPVRFTIRQALGGSCYVVHTGPVSACTCASDGVGTCSAGHQVLSTAAFPAGHPVQLSSSSASMLFDADRGTVTPTGTLRLTLPSGVSVNQVVNIMGRVRACSPGAAVSGFVSC